jgi:chemotaxis protein MotB
MFEGNTIVGKEQQLMEDLLRREQEKLKEMGEEIKKNLGKDSAVAKLMDQIKIEVIEEGLRIELLEGANSFFFAVGNAQLHPDAVRVLTIVAKEIGKMPNKVVIEGHTDSRQYSTIVGYTNFELSVDRANSARRVLAVNGLQKNQITEIRGYADTRLRNIADPYDITNRRISIIIKHETHKR